MDTSSCVGRDELAAFATGNLPRTEFARVARHVEECATCSAAVDELGGDDPLLAQLRRSLGPTPPQEPVPRACLDAALAAGQPPDANPAPGTRRLGKFEILEELGAGSFGCVFKARDTELDRLVALKVLRAGTLASRADIDRFLREARSTARLQHPGIVALHDAGRTDDGTLYLVEEFVPGQTLAARLAADRPGVREAAELVAELADALAYAHAHGVIHRDLKPSNVMLDAAGRPHLMDFGLAKREAEDAPMTEAGEVLGTPAYMSPEQARGDSHRVDARSDIYSLGVVLYELLTGERPFRGNRRMVLAQVIDDEPRPPRRLNDRIPRDLETVCLKAMAKVPARRYASAAELADDLRRWLRGEPIRARPAGAGERLWRWCRRNPVPAGWLLAVSLGSAIGLWEFSRVSEYLIRSAALDSAAQQSELLEVMNEFYSENVVERAQGVPATHDYASRKGAIPLPATMTIELGKQLSDKSASGMEVRLSSDFPFRTRPGGGPRDDFEREALESLRRNPGEPYYRFEEYGGRTTLRYATARRMRDTCIRCHNTHPDSTKTDWEVGDVRGVLEIVRPLDRDEARTSDRLRRTFLQIAAVFAPLLLVSVLVLLRKRR